MFDVTGRTIRTGDLVTYPVRQRSELWVNVGIVGFIDEDCLLVNKIDDDGNERRVRIENPGRVTIAMRGTDAIDMERILERLQPGE